MPAPVESPAGGWTAATFCWQDVHVRPPWADEPTRSGPATLQRWLPPVVDQGAVPLCSSAVVVALAVYFARRARGATVHPSVLFNYRMARHLTGRPDRRGVHIESSVAAWRRFGLPDERSWPWTSATVDADPPDGLTPLDACLPDVSIARIETAELTGPVGLDAVRAAVRAGLPVACDIPLHASQFSSFATGIIPVPRKGERPLGQHVALLIGFDDNARQFRVRNSWGQDWGDGGYGELPYAYLTDELSENAWVVAENAWISARDGCATHETAAPEGTYGDEER